MVVTVSTTGFAGSQGQLGDGGATSAQYGPVQVVDGNGFTVAELRCGERAAERELG